MRSVKLFATLFCIAALGFFATPRAKADAANQEIVMSVKGGAVDLPGHVLQPGTYDIRFVNLEHKVVMITTADGSRPIGFFEVYPISRNSVTDHAKLEVSEPLKDAPERLTGFFYPGLKTGYAFEYPHSMVTKTAGTTVVGSHS